MPVIITSIHDPISLASTCRRLNLPAPQEGCVHLADQEAFGWIIRLPGVRFPIVCDTLTGFVIYHPRDNGFFPYRRIARLIYCFYDVRHQLRKHAGRCPSRFAQVTAA